jgi:F-type H+-transporting ATPase subunit delta
MSLVEKRYAEALVKISFEQNAIDVYQEDLGLVAAEYSQLADFRAFLLSPEIKTDMKQNTLQQIFAGRLRPEVVNFLMLLVEKGRIRYLPEIYREFVDLADEKRSILHMTIVSPFPLDEVQIGKITGKYRALYNSSSVKANIKLDKSLIAGVKVIIGDKVIDGSAAGQLKALQDILSDM